MIQMKNSINKFVNDQTLKGNLSKIGKNDTREQRAMYFQNRSVTNSNKSSTKETDKGEISERPVRRKAAKCQCKADHIAHENVKNAKSIVESLKLKAQI